MEITTVYDLINRFDNSDITSMKLEMEGVKLSLSKDAGKQNAVTIEHDSDEVKEKSCKVGGDVQTEKTHSFEVKAPLAGTFYRAATPEDEPFIVVGKKVAKGDVIGIIEVMKMMNEVIAPVKGEITAIHISDGEMVEYDQVLVSIKEF